MAAQVCPLRACADGPRPGGAISGHFLAADGDYGGALGLDVWAVWQWLRIGGFFGVAATPSERDDHNRVFMPIGAVVAIDTAPSRELSVQFRARVGGWGGATQAEKLTGGLFVGGGAHFGYRLGPGAAVSIGLDLWGVIASDAWRKMSGPEDMVSASVLVIAPALGLSWTPEDVE
jgi:hypothetical protein